MSQESADGAPPSVAEGAPATGLQPAAETSSAPQEPVPSPAGTAALDVAAEMEAVARKLGQFAARQDELHQQLAARIGTAAETAPASEGQGEIAARLRELAERQEQLNRLFESRIHSDEVQARALERLHDEMQGYKKGFIRQEMLPLFKDIIFCYDLVAREAERFRGGEAGGAGTSPAATLDIVGQMLLDILSKYDVEPYRSDAEQFDRTAQQCVGTVFTDVTADDKKIAALGLTGFRQQDAIVRREQVTVYKYKPAGAESPVR